MVAATGYDLLKTLRPSRSAGAEAVAPAGKSMPRAGCCLRSDSCFVYRGLHLVAWFMQWVRNRGFTPFAIYRIIVGAAVMVWAMSAR